MEPEVVVVVPDPWQAVPDPWQAAVYRHVAEEEELHVRHAEELLTLLDGMDTIHRDVQIAHWQRRRDVAADRARRARRFEREAMAGVRDGD
jgi:SpoVK/Ycf46/Vps4 family AAA+-type ATPase